MLARYVILFIVLSLTACSMVGPDFKTPEAQVNDQWLNSSNNIDTSREDFRNWWESFNDPTLNTLVQKAYQQNIPLQVAGLRVFEARALLGVASGALYPQVQSLNASAGSVKISEQGDPVANFPPAIADRIDTRFDRYAVSFDAAWELDVWGRIRRGVESADALLAASLATYDDLLVTLTAEVAASYILLRTLEEQLEVTLGNEAIQQRSLEIVDVRFRNGLVTELDLQLAKALLSNTRSVLPQLEAAISQTRYALSLLLGMTPNNLDMLITHEGKIPDPPSVLAVGLPAELLRRRPDIRRNEALAAAQSARIGIAEGDLYPSFSLLGSIGFAAGDASDLFSSGSDFNFGLFSFDWKFLNYGRIKNNIRVEDARFQQAALAYQNSVLNAAREVESGLIGFIKSKDRVSELEKSVAASRRSVELAQTQYRDGIISYTLVLDAQQFLSLNEGLLTAARGDVARNIIATYKALGGGWELRNGNSLVPTDIKQEMKQRSDWGELLDDENVESAQELSPGSWRAPDF